MKINVTTHDGKKLVIDTDIDGYRKLQKICERSLFLAKELQQRTEQLAISQEHVAKLQEENRRLAAVEAEYRGHQFSQLRSTADHQLAADIKALTERVGNLEFAAKPGYFDPSTATKGEIAATDNLNAAINQQVKAILDREMRIGGILSRRS